MGGSHQRPQLVASSRWRDRSGTGGAPHIPCVEHQGSQRRAVASTRHRVVGFPHDKMITSSGLHRRHAKVFADERLVGFRSPGHLVRGKFLVGVGRPVSLKFGQQAADRRSRHVGADLGDRRQAVALPVAVIAVQRRSRNENCLKSAPPHHHESDRTASMNNTSADPAARQLKGALRPCLVAVRVTVPNRRADRIPLNHAEYLRHREARRRDVDIRLRQLLEQLKPGGSPGFDFTASGDGDSCEGTASSDRQGAWCRLVAAAAQRRHGQ